MTVPIATTTDLLPWLMMTASVALVKALARGTRWHWGFYTLSLTAGLYAHPWFGLVLMAHGVYVFWLQRKALNPGCVSPYLAAVQFAVAAFVPWLSACLHLT